MTHKNKHIPHISFVLPCYKEALNLPHSIPFIRQQVREYAHSVELIAVNDGSPDNTLEVLYALQKDIPELKVIDLKRNYGKGMAVRVGMQHASGQYVGYLDSDGEILLTHLSYYLEMLDNGTDIVVASKLHPLSNTHFTPLRRLMSMTYQQMNSVLFGLDIGDTQVGMKLMKRHITPLFQQLQTNGFAFDIEFLALAQKLSYTIKDAPVDIQHAQNQSSIGIKQVYRMILETFKIAYRLSYT